MSRTYNLGVCSSYSITPGYTHNCSGSNGGRHAAGATVSTTRPALTTTCRMPSRARSRVALGQPELALLTYYRLPLPRRRGGDHAPGVGLTKDMGERLAPRPASAARPRTPWNSPLLDFPCVPFSKHWDIMTESVESIGRKTHQYTNFRRPDVRLYGGGAAGGSRREAGP